MKKILCNICNTRPVDKNAGIQDACSPCEQEGGWENQHNDDRHGALTELYGSLDGLGAVELRKAAKGLVKNYGKLKSGELRQAIKEAITAVQEGCWICHPELNEAQMEEAPIITFAKSQTERKSRKGQVINVPLRAPGEVKADVTRKKIGKLPESKIVIRRDGKIQLQVLLDGLALQLVWDAEGHYDYAESAAVLNGKRKKVRNVAEALRIVGTK